MELQNAYAARVKGQLAAEVQKKGRKGQKGRLVGDGMPILLAGPEFEKRIHEYEAGVAKEAQKKREKAGQRKAYEAAVKVWKVQEAVRKEENQEKCAAHKIALTAYANERTTAKIEGRNVQGSRRTLGKLPGPIRKPALKNFQNVAAIDQEEAGEDFGAILEAIGEETEEEEEEEDD